jgi:CHASE2 domain-containing sensor protein
MFARLRRFLGYVLYLIGWGLAVLVLAQAIILSLATGSPLIPVVLGFVGIAIWAIGIFFRRIFAQR